MLDLWLERARERSERSVTGRCGRGLLDRRRVVRHSALARTRRPRHGRVRPPRRTASAAERADERRAPARPSSATPVRGRAAPSGRVARRQAALLPMRPQLGRVYTTLADPTPFAKRWQSWDSNPSRSRLRSATTPSTSQRLDFGPRVRRRLAVPLAAAELGIADRGFLDPEDRTVDLGQNEYSCRPSNSACSRPCPNDWVAAVHPRRAHQPGLGHDLCRRKQRRGCRHTQPPPETRSGSEPRRDPPRRRLPPQVARRQHGAPEQRVLSLPRF